LFQDARKVSSSAKPPIYCSVIAQAPLLSSFSSKKIIFDWLLRFGLPPVFYLALNPEWEVCILPEDQGLFDFEEKFYCCKS
jgi:hypothetical protein